ncbi:MAG: phospholipase D-like domain-containing protein [Candidatus Gastranaerophilales bacterium]|nr:phospholipase D-like domain-containing protein [Candidatus Gastranaerophilales bacterium]
MLSTFVIGVYGKNNYSDKVSFGAELPSHLKTYKSSYTSQRLKYPPKEDGPYGSIQKVQKRLIESIEKEAYLKGVSVSELLAEKLGFPSHKPTNFSMPSKTVRIDNLRVSSLIDGGQIFKKTLDYIEGAQKSIQVKMFEFQNLKIDGELWPRNGAENLPGAQDQQRILETIIKKKQSNPDMKIQMILDAHKWYIDGSGKRKRHYGNQAVIKYLKEKGIDVVFYPKDAMIQHEKVLIVDSKKAVIGGMNWGNHSCANHDACLAIEKFKGQNSAIDNLVHDFNTDFKFCWYKIGQKRFVDGPLNEEEQKLYKGINKEIKEENVHFYNLLKDYFDTPQARSRYSEGRLDLIEANPVKDSPIKILRTKPRELEEIGEKGSEGILDYLTDRVKTAKKISGELFFFTDKELIKTIIKRVKAGELDARFIIERNVFPYCENAYDELKEAGIDIRIYKGHRRTNQRMHAKWAIFDDADIFMGSSNWTSRALRQNLTTGVRKDLPLHTKEIEEKILYFIREVKPHENKLHLPNIKWDGSANSYQKLKETRKLLKSVYRQLNEKGYAFFALDGHHYSFNQSEMSVFVDGVKRPFHPDDERTVMAEVRKIQEFYKSIQYKHLSKEKYKRGNNEVAIVVNSPNLAKTFLKQFELDYNYSKSNYETENNQDIPSIPPKLHLAG